MTLRNMLKFSAVGASLLVSSVALAKDPVLACPEGTKQAGGAKTALEATMCVKTGVPGRVFHGPYVSFHKDGSVAAKGQFENGFRTGKFEYFSAAGVKEGESTFVQGDFHGPRVLFHPNGQKRREENWVKGLRQGTVREFDLNGKELKAVEYQNGRPVTASR